MYCEFYQLTERPFNVTPDPKFLYLNARYREAIASLNYGITQRKGFITLIGEAGTGKTTLLKRLLEDLDPKTKTVFIFNTNVTFEEILEYIFAEFDLPVHNGKKLYMLQRLNTFLLEELRSGGNVALLIDEAQDLEFSVLEDLRLLSNLETAKEKILQIVLSGQPELGQKLSNPILRQLRQRISINCRLLPLSRDEITEYLQYRLQAAGGPDLKLFTREAEDQIYHFSRGVPRLVNVVCDNALVIGYALGKKRIGADLIKEAAADLLPVELHEGEPLRPHVAPSSKAAASAAPHPQQESSRPGRFAVVGIVLVGLIVGLLSIFRTDAGSVESMEVARANRMQVIQPGSQAAPPAAPNRVAHGDKRKSEAADIQEPPPIVEAEPATQKQTNSSAGGTIELRDPRDEARRRAFLDNWDEAPPRRGAAPSTGGATRKVRDRELREAAPPARRPAVADDETNLATDDEALARENEAEVIEDSIDSPEPADDFSEGDGPIEEGAVAEEWTDEVLEDAAPEADADDEPAAAPARNRNGAAPPTDALAKIDMPPPVVREERPRLEVVREKEIGTGTEDQPDAGSLVVEVDEVKIDDVNRGDEPRLDGVRFARIRVQEGDSVSGIALRRYGQASATILDLLKLANPNVDDIDAIAVGQTIRLPQLDGAFPVLNEGSDQYSLLVFSTAESGRAVSLRDELRARGFGASVVRGNLGAGKPVQRVIVSGFESRDAVVEAGKRLQRLFREDARIAQLGRTAD